MILAEALRLSMWENQVLLMPSTFTNPFDVDPAIDRLYVVGPVGLLDMLPHVKPFIDLAVTKGVKRFVVLGASPFPKGGPVAGKVHEYLEEIGVEYAVLRPTWFMGMHLTLFFWAGLMQAPLENFSISPMVTSSIRLHNEIGSVAKDGRLVFVSVDDKLPKLRRMLYLMRRAGTATDIS